MKDDLFDKLIQQKASGHEAPVPADAWTNISEKKKKRRYAAWWWFTGVMLLAGIAVGGYFQHKGKERPTSMASVKTNPGNQANVVPEKHSFTQKTTGNTGINKIEEPVTATQTNDPSPGFKKAHNPVTNGINDNKTAGFIKNKNQKETQVSVSKNRMVYPDVNDGMATTVRSKKRINGRTEISIINSNPVTPDEDDPLPENGLLSTTANNITENIETSPVAGGQIDSTHNDNSLTATKKIDLLKLTPEKQYENNSVITKKEVPVKKRSGLYTDLSITPYIAFYKNDPLISVKRITAMPMRKTEFTATDIRSSTEAAFAYTLALRKNINKKMAIGTGIQYSIIKENVRLAGMETSTDFSVIQRLNPNNGAPFLFDDTVSSISTGRRIINATNSYSLVSVPLLVHYELYNRNKWAFSFIGGTYLNISTSYNNNISGEFQPLYKNGGRGGQSENKFTADLFAGLRASRRISRKYVAFAEPGFRYSLMKYDMQRVVNNKYIHRAGISFGVTWKLSN